MDIPLSSDALDLALSPGQGGGGGGEAGQDPLLLAVGLISGKVQLLQLDGFGSGGGDNSSSSDEGKAPTKKQKQDDAALASSAASSSSSSSSSSSQSFTKRWTQRPSKKSLRCLDFAPDGRSIWAMSKEGSLHRLDVEKGGAIIETRKPTAANEGAPSRCLALPSGSISNTTDLLISGDDDGVVKLWDGRTGAGAVRQWDHHFDWITDLHHAPYLEPPRMSKEQREKEEADRKRREEKAKRRRESKKRARKGDESSDEEQVHEQPRQPGRERLVVTSGDGTLSVIDVRATTSAKQRQALKPGDPQPGVTVSEDQEDELLSLCSLPATGGASGSSRLVVGTQLGLLSLWAPSRGLLDHVDRMPGHPASVDALVALDDTTVLTGSSDGLVRAVQVGGGGGKRFLGVVADHGSGGEGMPVERIKRRGGCLVSCGHGSEVKVTDVGALLESDDEDSDNDEEEEEADAEELARRIAVPPVESEDEEEEEVSEGEEEEAGEEDSEDESEDEERAAAATAAPRRGGARQKALAAGGSERTALEGADFFADL